ncbi:octopamine receptor beta-2r [Plakobranchus ocellatus]|uniref:Octopamine receptor beta-2r n=1 Tax=Plakobranchus ocellatus TaxID=259542 RepID=A0AAV3ZC07_9GAST|nr:octopamine receptor beta-2r [Plakobranchus ocellatus]
MPLSVAAHILVASMTVTNLADGTQCIQLGLLVQPGGMRTWLGLKAIRCICFCRSTSASASAPLWFLCYTATGSQDTAENAGTISCNRSGTVHNQGISFDLTRFNTNDINKGITILDANKSCCENTDNEVPNTVGMELSSPNIPKKTIMTNASLADGKNTDPPPEKTMECISTTNCRARNYFNTAGKSASGDNSTKHVSQTNVRRNDYIQEKRLFSKGNLKLIKFVLVLFGALFVCSAPSIVIITMFKLFKISQVSNVLIRIMRFVLIFNSCLNFLIISYMNKDFRQALIHYLPCCVTDLDTLRLIAADRPKWNALVAEIRKTAEAARSDDPASGRL